MKYMEVKTDPPVASKFDSYPKNVRAKLKALRSLILEVAAKIEHIEEVEETLKWGEPSYIVKKGSTVRIDWKSKNPDQYAMYFSCSTSLVETFRMVYGDLFKYEKNRAILFDLDEDIPQTELRECVEMALQYHLLKDKPLLGR
ncbi:DUF1801 domain-containing protein [Neolewinella aurantiaca]|uniref:DUF1801 domain-containing protein n=1 Tax=Neolewinella aurantiaca TaxID=2602767 RepID=A0A5C7FNP4_9BACT|nr:DUF1801 domain-containing protein [Neolewinella aurantiaca]TXF88032.1 DUF1801 domain-containing protein [Neolewinella aurantiaca]